LVFLNISNAADNMHVALILWLSCLKFCVLVYSLLVIRGSI
jgi:hypothetical protein